MDIGINIFKGLNVKSKPFMLADDELSDCNNVKLDNSGNIVKRNGFDAAISGLSNVVEIAYFRSKDEFVVFSNPSDRLVVSIYDASTYAFKRSYSDSETVGSQRDIAEFSSNSVYGGTLSEVNYTEFQNTLYFIIVTNGNPQPMLKYDGYVIRSTGLPEPESVTTTGTGYYYRVAYKTYDYNGNFLYGPYSLVSNKQTISSVKTLNTLIGYNKYAKFTATPSSGVEGPRLTATQNTLDNVTHNYVAGDFLMIFNLPEYTRSAIYSLAIEYPFNKDFVVLEVQSVTATSITFTPSSLSGISIITSGVGVGSPLDCQTRVIVFGSVDNESYSLVPVDWYDNANFNTKGYVESCIVQNDTAVTTRTLPNYSIMSTLPWEPIAQEIIYSSTTFKYRPPLCKYVTAFGDQLVYSDIYGIWAERNTFISYNNHDLIMYSDVLDGDSGENISRINRQIIGESFEGDITGAKRVKNTLIVFKTNSVWAIDGELFPSSYILRRLETNGIGCSSYKSAIDIEGGVLFHGNDGVYLVNSYGVKSISDKLDPLFDDLNLTKTRSAIKYDDSLILFFFTTNTNSKFVLAYDYDYKAWFRWTGMNYSSLAINNDRSEVFFGTSTELNKLNSTKMDEGLPIECYLITKFMDIGTQDRIKKFIKSRIISIGDCADLKVSVLRDWDPTTLYDSTNLLTMDKNSKHKYVKLSNAYSCAIKIYNNTLSDILISKVIFTVEDWQVSDRNN